MNQRIAKSAKALAITAFGISLPIGCGPSVPKRPVEAIVACDISCPVKTRLLGYAKSVYSTERALPAGSRLRVYVFGHGCDLVYDGDKIAGRDGFNQKVGEALTKPPADLAPPGTQTDKLFEHLAADVVNSKLPCLVLAATDGGMEDQGAKAMLRLRTAVKRLGATSSLQAVVLLGVQPQYRAQWEEWLRPLGSRAVVRGERDADGLARELACIGGAK